MSDDPDGAAAALVSAMDAMPIIDSHEHLPPEEELRSRPADLFTRLFCQYSPTAAASAGLTGARALLADTERPLEERWRLFQPYWRAIRDTGYVRAATRAARDLFGIPEITEETYRGLSQQIRDADTEGLYDRLLRRKCRIERIINQGSWRDDYAVGMYRPFMYLDETDARDLTGILARWEAGAGQEAAGALDWIDRWRAGLAADGYVGLKFAVSLPVDCIDDERAESLFARLRRGTIDDAEARELGTWMMHAAIRGAPDHGLVVAVHCGLSWEVNQDLLSRNPVRITPLLMRYGRTVFDLYHGGIPWVREMAAIGNQYPNAHLDLCWCHQISPTMTESMLGEWLDLVPASKIIGFGGDTSTSPYKIYGALCLAKENIARALAVRIRRGEMGRTRAEEICRMWLYENPRRIYRI